MAVGSENVLYEMWTEGVTPLCNYTIPYYLLNIVVSESDENGDKTLRHARNGGESARKR